MSLHHRVVNTYGMIKKSFRTVTVFLPLYVDPPTGVAACDQSFPL